MKMGEVMLRTVTTVSHVVGRDLVELFGRGEGYLGALVDSMVEGAGC
jgi:hypothetical protein